MVDNSGIPKGMKRVPEERGMRAREFRETKDISDFKEQKKILEEYVEGRGHVCIFILSSTGNLAPLKECGVTQRSIPVPMQTAQLLANVKLF